MSEPKEPVQNNHRKHLILAITVSIIIGGGIAVGVIFALSSDQSEGIPSLVNCDPQSGDCEPTVDILMDKQTFDHCVDLLITIASFPEIKDESGVMTFFADESEQILFDDSMFEYKKLGCESVESQLTDTIKWKQRNDS